MNTSRFSEGHSGDHVEMINLWWRSGFPTDVLTADERLRLEKYESSDQKDGLLRLIEEKYVAGDRVTIYETIYFIGHGRKPPVLGSQ